MASSAREARSFVSAYLADLGLHHVADAAALAVSELATNAVLHARSPFVVRVTPLPSDRVRVSVVDASAAAPVPLLAPNAAIGRGLRLVAAVTDAWGVEPVNGDPELGSGKEVWFELSRRPGVGSAQAPYDPRLVAPVRSALVSDETLIEVRFLNAPLQLLGREQIHHRELMREMALIASSDDSTSQVPRQLTALAAELETHRGLGAATDALRDAAIARGDTSLDLVYRVPAALAAACARLDELLDAADRYCRAENLLTLAASPEGLAVRRWYLAQVISQIKGAPAVPWRGPMM